MALEEQGQQTLWEFLKKMLKKCSATIKAFVYKKTDKAIEPHQMHSLKALARKNQNMGIHDSEPLSAEQAKLVGRELKKMRQDFFIKPVKTEQGETKYKIYVTNANKNLVDNLKDDAKARLDEKKAKLDEKLKAAREKANGMNKDIQHKQRVAERHKDVSL